MLQHKKCSDNSLKRIKGLTLTIMYELETLEFSLSHKVC